LNVSEVSTWCTDGVVTLNQPHVMTGNLNRFEESRRPLILDDEWKHKLPFVPKLFARGADLIMNLLLSFTCRK